MTADGLNIPVVRTGAANLASVLVALERCGARPFVTDDPAVVRTARRLVLPGVGAFGAAVEHLVRLNLLDPLRERLRVHLTPPDQPRDTLCICLGMQLLFERSDESPGVPGLGVAEGRVERFAGEVRVPQLGWNGVVPGAACRFLTTGAAYFANSFRIAAPPAGWAYATSRHAGLFVAAMERVTGSGTLLACQFHPELSGPWGHELLRRWCTGERSCGAPTSAPPIPASVARRVIPCLDVRDGRVVKGVRFQNLRDAGDPATAARAYLDQGADELIILDVSATAEGRRACLDTVRAVRRAINIPLTVGGGVRTIDDASALLEAGADKIGVNTAAVRTPEIITALAERFGRQCLVIAIDAARRPDHSGWEVLVAAGKERTGLDALAWAQRSTGLGAGEVLLTSWDRDGTGHGYDLELLRAVSRAVGVPVVASGGAAAPEHCYEALAAGAYAVLAATIFHDGRYTVGDVKRELASWRDAGGLGLEIRA